MKMKIILTLALLIAVANCLTDEPKDEPKVVHSKRPEGRRGSSFGRDNDRPSHFDSDSFREERPKSDDFDSDKNGVKSNSRFGDNLNERFDSNRFPNGRENSKNEESFDNQRDRFDADDRPRRPVADSIRFPSHEDNFDEKSETSSIKETRPTKIIVSPVIKPVEYEVQLDSRVHVTGSILLAQNKKSSINTVDYGFKGGRWTPQKTDVIRNRFNDDLNLIDPQSQVIVYVSTLNSFNIRDSLMNFTISYKGKKFPLNFEVDITLPSTLRRLLQTEDLKLYFFAYVYNNEPRFESFVPEGTCQILLQGTNKLRQNVELFVRTNGLTLDGVFHGIYGEKFIRAGTTFQISIISEESINRFTNEKVDYVAQILISDVPSMYPLTFNGLVPHRSLKSGVRYYAIAYIFEAGVERLLTPVPIMVINENRVVVTTELSIKVTPYPFMMYGTVTRLMPGSYYFEQDSSIILNFHQVDAQLPPITFRLPSIQKLPIDIQVNLSQALKFDPTKKYELLASIADSKNRIYMSSSRRILLDTTTSRFTIPVEDWFYHVRITFRASFNQQLTFIKESTATVIVTENPEATRAPLFQVQFDPSTIKTDGYLLRIPIRSLSTTPSAYLILLVNNTGIITHVSKVLFISNYQPPALSLDLPVIALNLLRGHITDFEGNAPQWSSWAYANIYLMDDKIEDTEKAIVQTWKIYLEREFPINFEVHVDFSRLIAGRSYSLQSSIETRPGVYEYKSTNTIRVIEPEKPIQDNVHLLVRSVKVSHVITGVVYLDSVQQYLTKNGEVVVYLSSNQVLSKPDIISEKRITVESKTTMVNFSMEISLTNIDMNGIYYFIVQYVSGKQVIIAPSQVFSYTPRNGASIILRLSKSEQIQVTGELISTGGQLILPEGSSLLLQITDTQFGQDPQVYSEVTLPATTTNLYRYTMYFDSVMVQRNSTVYLRAAIMYKNQLILSMPRPAPIEIQRNVVWNLVLTVDLPTLLFGQISLVGEKFSFMGDYDAFIQIVIGGTETVLSASRIRVENSWPQQIRVEVDNQLFVEHNFLEARAIIKNCKEEIIFRSANSVRIHSRLNLDLDLQIVPKDIKLLKELKKDVVVEETNYQGSWGVSLRGSSSFEIDRTSTTLEAGFNSLL